MMPKITKFSTLRNYSYESLQKGLWQRLFDELDESERAAERFGWIGEEKADAFIDRLIADAKT